ncbi:hypothetical protein ACIBSW_14965 [Actinoplanes sp. NPDC049668]|uniref:SCO4225 family membrane protein n=1 Tax=Actinoplanes sp. NPDC049668 TaxID=3363904 RepID=UPI0037A6C11A
MVIVRWFAGGRPSRIYLAVVSVAAAFAAWELLAWVEREAYVHGTYPVLATAPALFLTAPTSLLLEWWWPSWDGLWSWTVPVLVGALLNIAALKGIAALVRRLRAPARQTARRE